MTDTEAPIVVTGTPAVRPDPHGPVAVADWRVTLDGLDLSAKLAPLLIRLRVSERRGELADQLDIELDDSGQSLDIPKSGAVLQVSLGWKGGGGTKPGLIDKGKFTVDEAEHRGPPDTINIRARSVDFTAEWRKVREQSWRDTTLGAPINAIAGRQALTPRVNADLAARPIKLLTQNRESDIAFLERLGKEYDAISTVKNGTLIFTPMAGGKTASGDALPTVTLRRRQGDGHSYRVEAREDYTGVVAKWRDKRAAKTKLEKSKPRARSATAVPKAKSEKPSSTAGNGDNPKVLKQIFATQAEAERAAQAEWSRIQRAPRKFSTKLALGKPEIGADQPAIAEGYHPEIDAQDWIVADVTHTLDQNGLTSALNLEVPENAPEGGAQGDDDGEGA